MKIYIKIMLLLYGGLLSGQVTAPQSVYFDFDKFALNKNQINSIIGLINSPSFLQYDAIQLYGYCDDRGTEDYNYKLSNNRVATVQKILLSLGVTQNKIFICEGKGRVLLDKEWVENIEKTRYNNRRVDLIFIKNAIYTYFPASPKVGDLITLDKINFDKGSSVLTQKAKKELDRALIILEKNKSIRFEIKGHVCCTPSIYTDAIDQETQQRNLSINRAKTVFSYFRSKGISPYRMVYKGYGNRFPLGKEDALDRRVEFLITKI
ncbi:OmpA family protein [Flavobacterium sp.]|uniref:OmpA family protein n=1 Tax=Flavobacterium sp. TaxID=239 RepID=UPI00286AAED4|nr:OmpA family protein [Flavobacterium sp.]